MPREDDDEMCWVVIRHADKEYEDVYAYYVLWAVTAATALEHTSADAYGRKFGSGRIVIKGRYLDLAEDKSGNLMAQHQRTYVLAERGVAFVDPDSVLFCGFKPEFVPCSIPQRYVVPLDVHLRVLTDMGMQFGV